MKLFEHLLNLVNCAKVESSVFYHNIDNSDPKQNIFTMIARKRARPSSISIGIKEHPYSRETLIQVLCLHNKYTRSNLPPSAFKTSPYLCTSQLSSHYGIYSNHTDQNLHFYFTDFFGNFIVNINS